MPLASPVTGGRWTAEVVKTFVFQGMQAVA